MFTLYGKVNFITWHKMTFDKLENPKIWLLDDNIQNNILFRKNNLNLLNIFCMLSITLTIILNSLLSKYQNIIQVLHSLYHIAIYWHGHKVMSNLVNYL